QILLRFDNGARGMMWVSGVAAGETAGLRIRVYGEKGHVAWNQSRPDDLTLALPDGVRMLTRGGAGLAPAAKRATHMVAGLPEGFFDAFAVLYRDFAEIIADRRVGCARLRLRRGRARLAPGRRRLGGDAGARLIASSAAGTGVPAAAFRRNIAPRDGEQEMPEVQWANMKATEIRGLKERNAIAIVPIGSIEQHGPHLPV